MLPEEKYDDCSGQNSSTCKWMKPAKTSLGVKIRNSMAGVIKQCGQTLSPPLGSILSKLASGRLLPWRSLDHLCQLHTSFPSLEISMDRELFFTQKSYSWLGLAWLQTQLVVYPLSVDLDWPAWVAWTEDRAQMVSTRKRRFWCTDAVKIKIINVHYNDTMNAVDFLNGNFWALYESQNRK